MTKQKQTNKDISVITIKQIASPIGRDASQRQTLIGLGLNKIGKTARLEANLSTMGMIKKVAHLLMVEKA